MTSPRRVFLWSVAAAGTGFCLGAQAQEVVKPTDAQAAALGYVEDSAKVDKKKYPNHAATQSCANCGLYQGAAGSKAGPCPLFANKHVQAKGWCSAWVKKA